MLLSPINALKDIIAIMLYEITPEIVTKNGLKWACRLCLTLPPAAPPIMPLGQPGVLRLKEKMLLFFFVWVKLGARTLYPKVQPLTSQQHLFLDFHTLLSSPSTITIKHRNIISILIYID